MLHHSRQDGGERGGRDEHHGRHGARRGHQTQRPQAQTQEQFSTESPGEAEMSNKYWKKL